ncbi:glycosyltransferase family 4 protein [Rathayibacter soli]|uniref:glycosyltransferase family 4 protein n=1 Tax=Rathayibacter soli TaxID=3144168 RepID=UPI0027E50D8B|nr:glycosyltransferase family 4 protein [Glaciibacter superstes]
MIGGTVIEGAVIQDTVVDSTVIQHSHGSVTFLVPDGIDDPDQVSGGNVYDQHVRDELRNSGWDVQLVLVAVGDERQLAQALSGLPGEALVLIDGLLAVREPDVLVENSDRLRIIVLAHMVASLLPETPDGAENAIRCADPGTDIREDRERRALQTAHRVIATSNWTRSELITRDLAQAHRIVVAQPGTDPAPLRSASSSGGRLLCVGAVAPHKGQDLLLRSLAHLTDIDGWACTFVGSHHPAPAYFEELTSFVESAGLTDRVVFTGALTGVRLADAFGRADLVVVSSRSESYGMVVAEALARGIPVVATNVGGIPEAISSNAAGIVVPPEDPWALEVVLRQWLTSPARRAALNDEALNARGGRRSWSTAVAVVAQALDEVARLESEVPA